MTKTKPCQACGQPFGPNPAAPYNWKKAKYCCRDCYWVGYRRSLADVPARFWSKVDKRGPDECWGWKAQKRWDGYGRFLHNNRPLWSHRYSYELHNGPIPKGMHVLHSCHNPECTNPKHLRLGTHKENMREMQQAERGNATLSHDQVREARKLLDAMPATEIAQKFGVKPCVIYALKKGRNYRHVQ